MSRKTRRTLIRPSTFLLALLPIAAGAQTPVYAVGAAGTHSSIQAAIDACPATGCTIELTDEAYLLTRELWIEGKKNLSIVRSDALKAKGVRPRLSTATDLTMLAGTATNPTDPQRPAGWKRWPNTCLANEGGAKNKTNPYSTTGYLNNGMVVVKTSSDIVLDGLLLDGTAVSTFKNTGIWDCKFGIYHGNVGLNLFQSKNVTLRGSDVRHFFSALYINGRNVGGQYAVPLTELYPFPNATDPVIASQWGTKPGTTGDHVVEDNQFLNNIWVVYDDAEWDMASTFRFNRALDNRNTDFAAVVAAAGDDKAMAGGFLHVRDVVHNPHRIHNNTIWGSPLVIGSALWRTGVQHLFYNNIVGGFDRFANDPLLTEAIRYHHQQLAQHSLWLEHNLFETGTATKYRTTSQSSGSISDEAVCVEARLTSPCYVIWDKSVDVITDFGAPWLWPLWEVQRGAPYQGTYKGVGYSAPSPVNIEIFPGGGFIAGAKTRDILAARNRWVKTLPFRSLEPGNKGFLVPEWDSALVKTAVKGQARPHSGTPGVLDIGAVTFSDTIHRIHGLKSQRIPNRVANGCWLLPIQTDPEMATGRITGISVWTVPYEDNYPAVARTVVAIPDSSLVDGSALRVCTTAGSVDNADIRFQLETTATLKDGTTVAQEPAFYQMSAAAKITASVSPGSSIPSFVPMLRRTAKGLELTGLDAGAVQVTVRSLDGRVVRTLEVSPVAGSIAISRSGLPSGTLVLQVQHGAAHWQALTSAL